ncbi:MAG: zinc-ribbon domain-containing protein, partial [Methanobacteriaceae archaeon]|nr:zinc-ribbon domain-containing protein [Methanobacteriaceae archaeon]
MFCRKCGAKLKDEDKFCFNCGTPTTQEEAPKVTQEKVEPEPKEKLEDSLLDLDVEEENNEFDKDIIWEDPLADEMNKPEEDIEANKILEKFQKVKSENKKTAVEKEVVKEEVVEETVKEKTAMEGKIPIKETSTVVKETEEEPVKEEVNESESTEQLEQIPIMAQGKVTNDPIVKEVVEEPVKEEIVE